MGALMAPVACRDLSAWRGHTLLVEYSSDTNAQTRIATITDVASGAGVNDSELSRKIAEEANRQLPIYIQQLQLKRACPGLSERRPR
jgi:AraC-like DNA-binding protein